MWRTYVAFSFLLLFVLFDVSTTDLLKMWKTTISIVFHEMCSQSLLISPPWQSKSTRRAGAGRRRVRRRLAPWACLVVKRVPSSGPRGRTWAGCLANHTWAHWSLLFFFWQHTEAVERALVGRRSIEPSKSVYLLWDAQRKNWSIKKNWNVIKKLITKKSKENSS